MINDVMRDFFPLVSFSEAAKSFEAIPHLINMIWIN